MVYSKSSKILLIKSLWSSADNGGKKKKKVEVESNFFSRMRSVRSFWREFGIWNRRHVLGVFSSSLEVQTTWFQAGGGSFRSDYYYAK